MTHPTRSGPWTTHPWAWWAWALGVATAVSLTTNPLLVSLVACAVIAVVVLRRSDAPWARSVGAYLALAGFIIALRLVFHLILGSPIGQTELFRLPEIELPEWAAGIRLGGAVLAEGLAYTLYDALRLGVMLVCLGAANALANPRRALKAVPAALYEASVAVVIALAVAPQLVESTLRVRKARRLRGGAGGGWRAVRAVVLPVLGDAIDRSLLLAAAMESRGFGRTRTARGPSAALTALLLASLGVLTFGGFLLLGTPDAVAPAVGCVLVGVLGVAVGLRAAGRRQAVSRYRPDPWTPRDTAVALSGLVAAAAGILGSTSAFPTLFAATHPSTDPLVWPTLHPLMAVVLVGVLGPLAWTSPPALPTRNAA